MRTWIAALALALCAPAAALAGQAASLCVYDPGGANGDIFNLMKDYRAAAVGWGVDFELKPYTDEKTAAEDFKAGQCNAVLMTATRSRQLHGFIGTIEAMGALPTYDQLKVVVKNLSSAKGAAYLKSGDYDVAGIFPGGAVYLMVRDRNVDTVEELAGKRLATLDFDQAAKVMVKKVGATLVPADVSTFAGMFNNKSVDACYGPAAAYKPLELYKGIGTDGGVIRYPLAQMTLILLTRQTGLPETFYQQSRDFAADAFDKGLKLVKAAEKDIPANVWIDISDADKARYDEMFLDVRVQLRDAEKVYDGKMLKLLRGVRCKADGTRAECAAKRE
ncbi:MAG: putative solute-binding protein [bacterium]